MRLCSAGGEAARGATPQATREGDSRDAEAQQEAEARR